MQANHVERNTGTKRRKGRPPKTGFSCVLFVALQQAAPRQQNAKSRRVRWYFRTHSRTLVLCANECDKMRSLFTARPAETRGNRAAIKYGAIRGFFAPRLTNGLGAAEVRMAQVGSPAFLSCVGGSGVLGAPALGTIAARLVPQGQKNGCVCARRRIPAHAGSGKDVWLPANKAGPSAETLSAASDSNVPFVCTAHTHFSASSRKVRVLSWRVLKPIHAVRSEPDTHKICPAGFPWLSRIQRRRRQPQDNLL